VPHMKDKIIRVATHLFHHKGYFATSISEIAGLCGIQKASIYYHYASKEAILYQIHSTTMDDLTTYLKGNLKGVDGIEDGMRAAVRSHVRFHLERQKETFIANTELRGLTPEHYALIVAKRDTYEQIIQEIIRRGCAAGIFVDEDVKILSYAILTQCNAGAIWYKPGGRLTVDDIAEVYVRFALQGLMVR